MTQLQSTLSSALTERFTANAARIHELAAPLLETQFWHKPFPFGNSFGNLLLHLTGNLNYYIGAQIAKTGYVRDRPREFTDSKPSKQEALQRFDDAIAMVIKTIRKQSPDDWSMEYSGTGTDATNRLAIVMHCAAHMQHHIGQIIYLGYEMQREKDPEK
jgi:uncharacterized damage-inducible protein DinB